MLTGEPIPVEKAAGARVIGATINGTGSLVMRAEKIGSQTVLAQIVQMVALAQRSRAPMQRLADVVARWFVLAVLGIAVLTAIVWWLFGPEPRGAYAVLNAVAVLIIARPCALGLATPMSIMVASGRAATSVRAVSRRRGARDLAQDRYLDRRQDRHADARSAGVRQRGRRRTVHRRRGAADRGEHRPGQRTSARQRDRRGGARPRPATREARSVRVGDRHRRPRKARGALGRSRQHRAAARDRRRPTPLAARPSGCAPKRVFLAVDSPFAGLLAVHDPIKESTRVRSRSAPGRDPHHHGHGRRSDYCPGASTNWHRGLRQVRPQTRPTRGTSQPAKACRSGGGTINDAPAPRADVGIAMGGWTDVHEQCRYARERRPARYRLRGSSGPPAQHTRTASRLNGNAARSRRSALSAESCCRR